MITEEAVRKQLETLHQEGGALAKAFAKQEEAEPFELGYQRWYSRALPLMKALAPERYAEFKSYYEPDPKRSLLEAHSYAVQDFFRREKPTDRLDRRKETARCFVSQLAILKSVADRLAWMALDTEDQAARSLQLAELETARGLIKISARAAGALAGAVLEAYLRKLADKHQVRLRKQSPPLGELAEALKAAKVLDVSIWSQCTWLGEIRDRSVRTDGEGPTKPQVRDLIDGTHWLISNVF